MGFALLADLTLAFHLLFVLFVVGGGLLVWKWPKLWPWHLAAAAWGAFVALTNRVCPLTPLENFFLERAGRSGYEGGFLENYIGQVVYPSGLTPRIQAWLGGFVVVWNAAIYAAVALLRRRRA